MNRQDVIFWLVMIPSILLHEIMHGAVALAFGDDTAKRAGRLSINPIRHIDPFGSVILPGILLLVGMVPFGWAKPVPVNPGRMRHPRNHGLLVALAGPATNIALAVLAVALLRTVKPRRFTDGWDVFFYLGFANVLLAAFNLLPIPPLDGSSLIERVLPRRWLPSYQRYERRAIGVLLLIVLLLPGLVGRVLEPAFDFWFRVAL